jgi:hypothetical protein
LVVGSMYVLHVTAKVPCRYIFVTGLAVHLTCNSKSFIQDLHTNTSYKHYEAHGDAFGKMSHS